MESSKEVLSVADSGTEKTNGYCRWSGEVECYARRQCWKWLRQLAGQYDIDDLYQEAYLVFEKAVRVYGHEVDSERRFMAIYKRCFYYKFFRLNRDSKSAARRGCGGYWLGEHDREIADHRKSEMCLDDLPKVIVRMMERVGLVASDHGRRYIKVHRKRGEDLNAFFNRVVNGSPEDIAEARAYLGLAANN